jgi:hypothetical protein
MRPVPAKKFVDAVGIVIHPNRRRSAWGTSDWERAILETGVMNVRGLVGSRGVGRAAMSHLEPLFRSGVKLCATVAPAGADFDLQAIGENLDFLARNVGAANLCGIESANEYNKPSRRPQDWVTRLRHFQAWLYESVKANPNLRGVPVVGPSIWGRLTDDIRALGNLEPYIDKACLHYYTGGRRPTRAGRPSSSDEGGGSGDYTLSDAIKDAEMLAPGKGLYVTEFGYPIAGPGLPPSKGFITPNAAAKYLVRGLFDMLGEGVEKIFIYTLIDDVERNPPRYHGLMSGSLERRPTFYAVKNLMALMHDTGIPSSLQPLDFTLSNASAVKTMLFQKSDGSYLLAMYQDADSYDRKAAQDIDVKPVPATLTLARAARSIELFAPTFDSGAKQKASNANKVNIPVGDQLIVLKIVP